MRYVKQFLIILTASFLGELIHAFVPLPVPASIYGLVLLFLALQLKLVPLHAVKETGDFLLDIMPIMFVPAGVSLLEKWGVLRPVLVPFTVIMVATTFIVMVISGRVTQRLLDREAKGGKAHE